MSPEARSWVFVAATLMGTVIGQITLKYAIDRRSADSLPAQGLLGFTVGSLTDPLVLLSLLLALLASLTWIAAMTRLTLSAAYPFQSLSLVFTILLSCVLLNDDVSLMRWAGIGVVVAGLVLVARG